LCQGNEEGSQRKGLFFFFFLFFYLCQGNEGRSQRQGFFPLFPPLIFYLRQGNEGGNKSKVPYFSPFPPPFSPYCFICVKAMKKRVQEKFFSSFFPIFYLRPGNEGGSDILQNHVLVLLTNVH